MKKGRLYRPFNLHLLVHQRRFELPRLAAHAPQACASTGSATGAFAFRLYQSILLDSRVAYK